MKMHNPVFSLAIALALLSNIPAVEASPHQENTRPAITLIVCDKAGLEPGTLREAMNHTKQVFANAGIDLVWVDTPGDGRPTRFSPASMEGCTLPSVDGDFLAVVTNDLPDDWPPEGLGFSTPGTSTLQRLYVFYQRLRKALPKPRDSSVGVVLGHVIAHELGHFLLSETGHTLTGIMSTKWGYRNILEAAQGVLRFDPAEAQRIRAGLQDRSPESLPRPVEASVLRSASLTSTEIHK
jgi:hypothetical protein